MRGPTPGMRRISWSVAVFRLIGFQRRAYTESRCCSVRVRGSRRSTAVMLAMGLAETIELATVALRPGTDARSDALAEFGSSIPPLAVVTGAGGTVSAGVSAAFMARVSSTFRESPPQAERAAAQRAASESGLQRIIRNLQSRWWDVCMYTLAPEGQAARVLQGRARESPRAGLSTLEPGRSGWNRARERTPRYPHNENTIRRGRR